MSGFIVTVEALEEFQVNQSGNTINIVQKSRNMSSGVVIGNVGNVVMTGAVSGTTVISSNGQDIRIVNGRVYVNGKEVSTDGSTGSYRYEPKVKITAPTSDLDATLAGNSLIVSSVPLKNT